MKNIKIILLFVMVGVLAISIGATAKVYNPIDVVTGVTDGIFNTLGINATSTFANSGVIVSTDANNLLKITPSKTYSSSASLGGAININNSLNGREALVIYQGTNQVAKTGNGYIRLENASTTYSDGALFIKSVSSSGGDFEINMSSPNPDIEFVESDQTAPAGLFEIDVNNDNLRFNSRNAANNSFETNLLMAANRNGGQFYIGSDGNVSSVPITSAKLELVNTSSTLDYFRISTATSTNLGNIFTVYKNGNIGIATSTPAYNLHIAATASSTIGIGAATLTGCIVMGDTDKAGITYVTALDGVLTATTTKPSICQ